MCHRVSLETGFVGKAAVILRSALAGVAVFAFMLGAAAESAVDTAALRGKTVLLLGDSIRMGYAPAVREKLRGIADVYYPEENCRFAYYTLRGICDWVKLVPDPGRVDVVHWNNGLWDLGQRDGREPLTPIDVYAGTIGRVADEIRHYFPNAKIVFATTTPLNPATKSPWHTRGEQEVVRYNSAAIRELKTRHVLINDLNAFVKHVGLSGEQKDIVHFSENGYDQLADEVIGFLSSCLSSVDQGRNGGGRGTDPGLPQSLKTKAHDPVGSCVLRIGCANDRMGGK